jgi:hypothetical protein
MKLSYGTQILIVAAALIILGGCSAAPDYEQNAVYLYSGDYPDKTHDTNTKIVATFNASKWADENMAHCQKMLAETPWTTEVHFCQLGRK